MSILCICLFSALVPSSSELKQSQSSNSGSSCDEDANKDAALDGKLFGNMVCDDDDEDNEIMSDSDEIDDDSDTINNLVVPTMFCKPVFIEDGKPSNLSNSDSQSAANSDESETNISKRLDAESSDSDNPDNGEFCVNFRFFFISFCYLLLFSLLSPKGCFFKKQGFSLNII